MKNNIIILVVLIMAISCNKNSSLGFYVYDSTNEISTAIITANSNDEIIEIAKPGSIDGLGLSFFRICNYS